MHGHQHVLLSQWLHHWIHDLSLLTVTSATTHPSHVYLLFFCSSEPTVASQKSFQWRPTAVPLLHKNNLLLWTFSVAYCSYRTHGYASEQVSEGRFYPAFLDPASVCLLIADLSPPAHHSHDQPYKWLHFKAPWTHNGFR